MYKAMKKTAALILFLLLGREASAQVTSAPVKQKFATCTDSVGTDAYACTTTTPACEGTLASAPTIQVTVATANTGAATFAYCGLAAKAIVKTIGGISTALATNDILAKQPVLLVYNATDDNWKMISAISNAPTSTVTANGIGTAMLCIDAGANDTYTCSLPTAPTYTNGQFWAGFQANTVNTGTASINFNSVGALTIVKTSGGITTVLTTGDIKAGAWVLGFYDGTNFQCVNCDGNAPIATQSLTLTGPTAARTLTFNDSSYTVPGSNIANSWSADQTLGTTTDVVLLAGATIQGNVGGAVGTANNYVSFSSILTPDSMFLGTGTTSNAWSIFESGDLAYDFTNPPCGSAACVEPTLSFHTEAQNTTNYRGFAVTYDAGGALKALTESSATSVVVIPVAPGAYTGGTINYTVTASDGTDHQSRGGGQVGFSIVNKAGTETCAVFGIDSLLGVVGSANPTQTQDGTGTGAMSSGTLTYVWGVDTTGTNQCAFTLNAVSSLTQTTLQIIYTVNLRGVGLPARQ